MKILDQIVAAKRREVEILRPQSAELRNRAGQRTGARDFAGALRCATAPALIAEIKKASPSAGVIRADFDPVHVAREYAGAGAAALSVLTDEQFFQGRLDFIESVRAAVPLPVLRKDFLIDDLQVCQSIAHGADAILLIVAILDDAQLRDFQALARAAGLAVLVEVHDDAELERALTTGAELIGINNRDLRDFSVNLAATERLAAKIPNDRLVVAESGIHTRADVRRVAQAGARAILVGEALMRRDDLGGRVRELLGGA